MLCVPAGCPDGSSRPAQGTNPHKHKTEWEVCTKRASTPHQKHASAQGDTVNTWEGEVILQDQGAGPLQLCWALDVLSMG